MTLGDQELMAFSQTTQPARAKAFYGNVLGLPLEEDTPFALVFRAGVTTLRVQKVEAFSALAFTSLGWKVPDIRAAVRQLTHRGVAFERYPGMSQDVLGIWQSPSGAQVCWFKDPDGNTLSLTQFP